MKPRSRPRLQWSRALLVASTALWAPFVVAAVLDHRVRRILGEFWIWPGIVPGRFVFQDLYDERFGAFTALHVIGWTWLARRRPVAALGALLTSTLSAGNLVVLLAI